MQYNFLFLISEMIKEVTIFLSAVGAVLIAIVVMILYLNKMFCFKQCQGKTCFDVSAKSNAQTYYKHYKHRTNSRRNLLGTYA